MTTALVTGAGGFIAPHVATALRIHGVTRVIGHDLAARTRGPFDVFLTGPVDTPEAARALLDGAAPDAVVHLAGRFRGTEPQLATANVTVTRALVSALASVPRCRFVSAGSAAEYGVPARADGRCAEDDLPQPVTPYGRSKAAATRVVLDRLARGGHAVVARLFNVVGAGMSTALFLGAIVQRLKDALSAGAPPIVAVGNLGVRRDFVAVHDAADVMARLVTDPGAPIGVCNVASGVATPLTALTAALEQAAGVPVRFETDPSLVRADDPPCIVGDVSRIQRWLGRVPVLEVDAVVAAAWAAR